MGRQRDARLVLLGCTAGAALSLFVSSMLVLRHLPPVTPAHSSSSSSNSSDKLVAASTESSSASSASHVQPELHPVTRQPGRPKPIANYPKSLLNMSRCDDITKTNGQFVYVPSANTVVISMSKAGTTSFWHWLHVGLTGQTEWDRRKCGSVHSKHTSCWRDIVQPVHRLSLQLRHKLLTDPQTLRIALQRDPYQRLLSAFRSKYSCSDDKFHVDVHDRKNFVRALRSYARLPTRAESCVNITEFAEALDKCRLAAGHKSYLPSLRTLERHIRPQQFYFDDVQYHMIIDVAHLNDPKVMKPLADRLPFPKLVADGVVHRHSSGEEPLFVSPENEAKLRAYADHSAVGQWKFLPDALPSKVD